MKKLLMFSGLLALGLGLAAVPRAADTPPDAGGRRVDSATYRTAPETPQQGGAAQAAPVTQAPLPVSPIAELLAVHRAEALALTQALAHVRSAAERQALESRVVEMKQEHQREELTALRADALLKRDMAYVARLDAALGHLDPAPLPAAVVFVPRDPVTGRALEGGVK